jgi:hypothetical protein
MTPHSPGRHQVDDGRVHIWSDLVNERVADEARQQDGIDAARFEPSDKAEGVQLAPSRIVFGTCAAYVAGKALLFENDRITLVIRPGGGRAY